MLNSKKFAPLCVIQSVEQFGCGDKTQSTNTNQFKKIYKKIFLRGIWIRKGCLNCLSFILLTPGGYLVCT